MTGQNYSTNIYDELPGGAEEPGEDGVDAVVHQAHLLTVLLNQPTKPLGSKGKQLNCVKVSKFCSGCSSSKGTGVSALWSN